MTLPPAGYNAASTIMHEAQGAALLVLGLNEAYAAHTPGGRIRFASPLTFLLSGVVVLLTMLNFLGGWNVANTLLSLQLNRGFYIFISFACFYASAGLSQLTFLYTEERTRGWHYLFLFFLAVIGFLYFGISQKVSPGAAVEVAAYHSAFGFTLIAAVSFKFLHDFRPRRVFNLVWIVFLLISSFQLLTYREVEGAFDLDTVNLQTSPQIYPPAAAAKSANKDVKTTHP